MSLKGRPNFGKALAMPSKHLGSGASEMEWTGSPGKRGGHRLLDKALGNTTKSTTSDASETPAPGAHKQRVVAETPYIQ